MLLDQVSSFCYQDDVAAVDEGVDGAGGGAGGGPGAYASRRSIIEYYNRQAKEEDDAGGAAEGAADAPSEGPPRAMHMFAELERSELPLLRRPFTAAEVFKVQHALRRCAVLTYTAPAGDATTRDAYLEKIKEIDLLLHVRGSFLSANRHVKGQYRAFCQAMRAERAAEGSAPSEDFDFYTEEDEEAYYRSVLRPFYEDLNHHLKYNCIFLFDNFEIFREARAECSGFRQNRFFMMMVYHAQPAMTPPPVDHAALYARARRARGGADYERNAALLPPEAAEMAFLRHLVASPDVAAWAYVGGPRVVEISTTERAPAVPALEALSEFYKLQLRHAVLFTRFVATDRQCSCTTGAAGRPTATATPSEEGTCTFNPISLDGSRSSAVQRWSPPARVDQDEGGFGAASAAVAFSFAGLRVFARGLYQLLVLVEQGQLTFESLEHHYFPSGAASQATPQGPLFTWQTLGIAAVWAEVCQQQYHLTEAALRTRPDAMRRGLHSSCYVAALPTVSLLVMELIAADRSSFYAPPSLFAADGGGWGGWWRRARLPPRHNSSAFYTVCREEVELPERSTRTLAKYLPSPGGGPEETVPPAVTTPEPSTAAWDAAGIDLARPLPFRTDLLADARAAAETDSATTSDISDADTAPFGPHNHSGSFIGSSRGNSSLFRSVHTNRRTFLSVKQTFTRMRYILNPNTQRRLEEIRRAEAAAPTAPFFYDAFYRSSGVPPSARRALDVNDVHRCFWYPMVDEAVNLLDGVAPPPPPVKTSPVAAVGSESSSEAFSRSDLSRSLSGHSNSATLSADQVQAYARQLERERAASEKEKQAAAPKKKKKRRAASGLLTRPTAIPGGVRRLSWRSVGREASRPGTSGATGGDAVGAPSHAAAPPLVTGGEPPARRDAVALADPVAGAVAGPPGAAHRRGGQQRCAGREGCAAGPPLRELELQLRAQQRRRSLLRAHPALPLTQGRAALLLRGVRRLRDGGRRRERRADGGRRATPRAAARVGDGRHAHQVHPHARLLVHRAPLSGRDASA
ncbi:hypothetical protein STCU_10293 [Strigomonas culicis]|uniref:Uncharacterized protein n=1 Tax=Strigomonas culicis TaxID=28005 RepID=S9TIP0_9TRYP|nr:hypothetical protein STCU_10293 [Strigomonas culicis]|eukprot:EPY17952.1 hypothetical protein STCU_10293 [Strigomonas culicis]